MGDRWLRPVDEPPRPSTDDERGAILVELLDAPMFRRLCDRR